MCASVLVYRLKSRRCFSAGAIHFNFIAHHMQRVMNSVAHARIMYIYVGFPKYRFSLVLCYRSLRLVITLVTGVSFVSLLCGYG